MQACTQCVLVHGYEGAKHATCMSTIGLLCSAKVRWPHTDSCMVYHEQQVSTTLQHHTKRQLFNFNSALPVHHVAVMSQQNLTKDTSMTPAARDNTCYIIQSVRVASFSGNTTMIQSTCH